MLFYRTGLGLEHQALSAWIATDPCVLGSSLSTEYSAHTSSPFHIAFCWEWKTLGADFSCLRPCCLLVVRTLGNMSVFTATWRTRLHGVNHRTLLRFMDREYPSLYLLIVYIDSHDASDPLVLDIHYYVDDAVMVLRAPRS